MPDLLNIGIVFIVALTVVLGIIVINGFHLAKTQVGHGPRRHSGSRCSSEATACHCFSSRLSSAKKRQSVAWARSFWGVFLIKPASCRRRA